MRRATVRYVLIGPRSNIFFPQTVLWSYRRGRVSFESGPRFEFQALSGKCLRPIGETVSRKEGGVLPGKPPTVFVVDDDDSVRKALKRLLSANGYQVMAYESAEDFLLADRPHAQGCIVLDIRLPGMSGLDLYEHLASSGRKYPIIFITAQDNPEWQGRAAETDAIAYLRKPFDQRSLLDALDAAFSKVEESDRMVT